MVPVAEWFDFIIQNAVFILAYVEEGSSPETKRFNLMLVNAYKVHKNAGLCVTETSICWRNIFAF